MGKFVLAVLTLWNLATFFMMGLDKYKARKNKWRISEKALLTSAFLMGGDGGADRRFRLPS